MFYAKCLEKIRMGNEVVGYKLQDSTGSIVSVPTIKLKIAMARGLIEVENLKLTVDGRIIDKVKKVLDSRCVGEKYNEYGKVISYQLKKSNGNISNVSVEQVLLMLNKNPNAIENIRLDPYRGIVVQY